MSNLVDSYDLNTKLATLAIKEELKAEQDKIVNLEAFASSFLCGKSYFEVGRTQNYLLFQAILRYFKTVANFNKVTVCK